MSYEQAPFGGSLCSWFCGLVMSPGTSSLATADTKGPEQYILGCCTVQQGMGTQSTSRIHESIVKAMSNNVDPPG
jgi:hypothetical protein